MTSALTVSDHALVRWMERTGLVDIEPLRSALTASLRRAAVAAQLIGGGEFLILADGLVYVVRDGVVATVLQEDSRHTHVRALRARAGNRGGDQAGRDA